MYQLYMYVINDIMCTVYNVFLEKHCRLLQPVFYVNQTSIYKSDFLILTKCSTMNNEYVLFKYLCGAVRASGNDLRYLVLLLCYSTRLTATSIVLALVLVL